MAGVAWEPSTTVRIAAAAALATAAIVAVAIAAYALGSFLLMGRHVGARQLGRSLRELWREVWIAAITQPFLPLFYLVGYRMDFFVRRGKEGLAKASASPTPVGAPASSRTGGLTPSPAGALAPPPAGALAATPRVPLVFVHGYMQNRVDFVGMAHALARYGVGPMFGFNYPWFASMVSNAARLDRFIARVCEETGSTAVDLICHSMGGLVAMEMMRDEARKDTLKVRRCVTIATPHAGVMWRGPMIGVGATSLRRGSKLLEAHAGYKLAVPCLSVYSTHDNMVHPKESSSLAKRGGRDVEVDGLAHLAILFSPKVAELVAAFLAEPDPV